jgi:hypothetical protein
MTSKVQALKESASILVEGLPSGYNQLMLQELVRGYNGLQDYKIKADSRSALVHFTRHEDAKIALAGKYFLHISVLGLNKFKVDKEGHELRASFYAE